MTFGISFQSILENIVNEDSTIVVQSLVLRITPSCPVLVSGVNDEECDFNQPTSVSHSNTLAIVGGAIGGLVLVVLIVIIGVVLVVVVVAVAKHRIALVKIQNEAGYVVTNKSLPVYHDFES